MDQMPLRRSLRPAVVTVKPTAPAPDEENDSMPVKRSVLGGKKRVAEAAPTPPPETVPASKAPMKRARRALNDHMTSAGQRADLSKHALGHLLVSSPAVLDMLSTRDARHLRRADKALRSIVAEHPWKDIDTPVYRLVAEWRASFPVATACHLASPIYKAAMPFLAGLTSFRNRHFFESKAGSVPTAHTMPRLTVLNANCSFVAPGSPALLELGDLLSLHVYTSPVPIDFLGNFGSLRVLELSMHRLDSGTLSPGLFAVPLLESLSLKGFSIVGPDLAPLMRLNALAIADVLLSPDIFKHTTPSLRALKLECCSGVVDATFAPPALGYLQKLSLIDYNNPFGPSPTAAAVAAAAITPDALAGLTSLEVFHSRGYRQLQSGKALAVLGSMGRLRHLSWTGSKGDFDAPQGFDALEHCPVTDIELSGSASSLLTLTSTHIARLPASLRSFRFNGIVSGIKPWTSLASVVVLDLSESTTSFGADYFSALVSLRTLALSGCANLRREALVTLPVGVTSLELNKCMHLEVDDELLSTFGSLLPGLSHLSLRGSLASEVDPVFRDPELTERRLKTPDQIKRHRLALRMKQKKAKEAEADGESSDGDGPVSVTERRRRKQASRFGYLGKPPHTTVAGWTALLRLPRGLYSLDISVNDLSYDSYALLRLHVGELRAAKVKSPGEEAVAEGRRNAAAVKRGEKKRRVAEGVVAVLADSDGAAAT